MKKIDLESIQESDLTYFGERAEPPFGSSAIISGMQNRELSRSLLGLETIVRWLQVNHYFYQFAGDLLEIEAEVKNKFDVSNNQYINSLIEQCLQAGDKLREVSLLFRKYVGDKSADKKVLADAILVYSRALSHYTVFYQITFFERPLVEFAEELVKKYTANKEEAQKLYDTISVADRLTTAEYEQDDFLRLAGIREEELPIVAENHAQKYGWLGVRYFIGDAWTKETVLKRLEGINKTKALHELEIRLAHRKEREQKIEKAISSFSVQDKHVVDIIRKVVYLRTQRGDFVHESAAIVRPVLDKIAQLLNISYEGLICLSADEVSTALKGEFDYVSHVKNRLENFLIYHVQGDEYRILEGAEVVSFVQSHPFLDMTKDAVTEFSGKTGYAGCARGTVKIIKTGKDVEKFERGDILVTTMTTSNLLPALEKASAFVTDEGGITCHAAIMAREMRKPCVVGTKNATHVVKDGDIVEVNADTGVVKIVK